MKQCKECNISKRKCSHNKFKTQCRECGGSALCSHNIRKSTCKECKGSSICSHGIQKTTCRECGGSALCSHGIQKITCRECGGSQICIHGIQKARCRECGGSQICIHNKIKASCKECEGSQICIHNKFKTQCKECGGSAICSHGIQKITCRQCGGSALCSHDKIKASCIICNPDCACIECKSIIVNKRTNCYPLCQACFCNKYPDHEKSTLYKIKERYLRDELRVRFPDNDINMIFDKAVDGGCSKKRPDVLIDLLLYSIIIECDENQHKVYECENKRTMQLFEDLGNRPLIMIRFNPDDYIDKDKKIEGCFKPLTKIEDIHKKKFYELNKKEWKRRVDILEEVIREKIREDIPEKEVEEIKLFYDYK
jgi:hypothetical protein